MSQTQDFDPYYTWLGIPPEEQPPNHYRLLGIKPLETNADVIANAADRQVRHVRTYQSGKHADQSQEVLNKLSAARVCLLNTQTKAEYDEQLAKKLKPVTAAPARPASRSGTKLVTATAIEDATPRPAPGLTPLPASPHSAAPLGGPQIQPGMHPAGPHAHGPLGPMPLAAPPQGVPPWMVLAGIGGGVLLLLIVGGAALAFMLGGKPNPPVVMPGPQPSPFVRPNPRPNPNPPNPFVPVGPMPGGPTERPRMIAGAEDGHPSDPTVTLGLIGEIRVGPAQLLVRYRLGETIDGAVLEKLRQDNNWPPFPRLRLTGSLDVPQPTKALARLDVEGTTPRPTDLRVASRPWIRRDIPQGGTETHEGDLPGGTTTVEWTIEDVTTGKWKLDLVNPSDQSRVPVAVPRDQLASMRSFNRGTELLFAARPLLVSSQGGNVTAAEFGAAVAVPPVGPPVASNNLQPALPSDAVAGADDDLNATTGLLGRLQINGQDVGVLVRYRLGGVLTQAKLNEVSQSLGLPAGHQKLVLAGQLGITDTITGEVRQQVGPQTYGQVVLDDARRRRIYMNRAGRAYPNDKTDSGELISGTGKFRWDLDGTDFGSSSFTLRDKVSGTPLQTFYTKAELDDARRLATLAEMVVLPDRILFRDKETLVAAVPKDPTTPTGDDALVRGDEEDPATTTGLLGRLFIDGQDVGVVFRYRPGRSFNSGWFDDMRRQLNLPAGMPELVLTGTIDIVKPRTFGGSGKSVHFKMSGGTRGAGTSQLLVNDATRISLGGNSYQTDGTDFSYLQPGKHAVKWTIRGAPIGDCLLTISSSDGQKVEVGYSTNELKAARKLPLKQEFILAAKNTLAMRYAGGRLVGTTKISTDPTAGPGTIVAAPMADPAAPAAKREPLPTDEKLKGAEALVKDVFGKDIDAAKSVPEKAALAKKLLQSSRESSDDLAARYVLLTKCKDFAAASGDTVTMCSAIDELDGAYEVDGLKLKSSGFFQASNAALPPTEFGPMTREVLDLIDATIADDRFDLAIKLVDVAGECARRSKDKDLAKQAGDKKRDVVAFKKQFETIDTAQQKLKESPDDGEANLTLGKYKALVKGDWTTGLPHLAKGSDGAIAAAAKLDAAGAADKDARVKLGDAWWDLGEKAAAEEQLGYKLRAHTWYKQALPELSGVAQLKVEKRIGEVDEEASKQAARSKPAAGGGNRPQPGLIVRVYDRDPTQNRPTHMVAVVSDSDEINRWVETAVRDETNKLGTSISRYYVATGFIHLTANTTVAIDVTYAAISIDNRPVTDASYSAKQFQIPLTRGMHPITIVCNNSSSMRYTIVDQKSGTNVLYYDAKQLQAELGRTVNGPRGQAVKSSLLQRKTDPRAPGF